MKTDDGKLQRKGRKPQGLKVEVEDLNEIKF